MEHVKKQQLKNLFSPETEHRGNDKAVARNFSLEINLIHNINDGKPPTTTPEEK